MRQSEWKFLLEFQVSFVPMIGVGILFYNVIDFHASVNEN